MGERHTDARYKSQEASGQTREASRDILTVRSHRCILYSPATPLRPPGRPPALAPSAPPHAARPRHRRASKQWITIASKVQASPPPFEPVRGCSRTTTILDSSPHPRSAPSTKRPARSWSMPLNVRPTDENQLTCAAVPLNQPHTRSPPARSLHLPRSS